MRVLSLHSRLSDRGGADRWLLGHLARLQAEHETRLVVGQLDPRLDPAERARVGAVTRVAGLELGGLGRPTPARALAALSAEIERFAPDVLHLNDVVDVGVLGLAAATGRAVMTVQDHRCFCPGRGKVMPDGAPCRSVMGPVCAACNPDPDYGPRLLALTGARFEALSRMAAVTVLSRYMADELVAAGLPGERVTVIPPFVDALGAPAPSGPAAYHLLAGRLAQHKGVAVALEAAQRRAGSAGALPLVVAGAGPLEGAVRAAAAAAPEAVRFVGWADRPGMEGLLSGARSLWLPSLWAEPFGIIGLEALAAGVPVIATPVGGVAEWLVEDGLCVPPGDARALAAAADVLDAQPDRALHLGERGRLRVSEGYAPAALIDRLVRVLQTVAQRGCTARRDPHAPDAPSGAPGPR